MHNIQQFLISFNLPISAMVNLCVLCLTIVGSFGVNVKGLRVIVASFRSSLEVLVLEVFHRYTIHNSELSHHLRIAAFYQDKIQIPVTLLFGFGVSIGENEVPSYCL